MAREYVVVDLETTGLDIDHDEIIEIAAVKICRGLIIDRFSSLVACDLPLKPEIVDLTGIDDAMLAGQPRLAELLPAFADFVGQADLAAHNAEFDAAFLHKYWPDERKWLDTIVLAQIVHPTEVSYSLANLCASLNIEHEQAHRALGDALATAALFIALEKQLDQLPWPAREDILLLAAEDTSPTGELLRHKLRQQGNGDTERTEQDALAPRWSKREERDDYDIREQDIRDYLGGNSSFRQRIAGFEDRPSQIRMSLAVAETLNRGGCLLAEAGTGTGKSLAYLLPSALKAVESGKQVAISTHTRNLQEQLLNKDIPMLEKLLDQPIHAAVLKGRGNYLCRRLYRYMLEHAPESLRYFLMRVAVWRAQSASGEGGELNLTAYDQWKWQRICAAKENCAPFCPYARRNACIVQRARTAAARADLLILNHSLLIANAAVEKGFLPALPYLIIDEAQHIEHAAEDQLTARADIFEVLSLLGRLKRHERGHAVGAIAALRKHILAHLTETAAAGALSVLDRLDAETELVIAAAERLFDLVAACFRAEAEAMLFYPARIRLLPRHRDGTDWQLILQAGEELRQSLNALARYCFDLLDRLTAEEGGEDDAKPPGAEELYGAGVIARELAGTVDTCLDGEDENYVAWIEFADAGKKPSLNTAPVEIGNILRDSLYDNTHSLVMTSATLAAGQGFCYFKQRLGLDLLPEPPRELVLPSPFFYRDQALFTIVTNLPDWSKCSETVAVSAISEALIRLLAASEGRAIVLFTSHYQLKAVFEQIRWPLRERGITVLAHGVSGGVSSLLKRLKSGERCCILGANSFWEGVDVLGSALSLIVVVRLPFWPPNSPLAAARMERIEAEGGSSFNDFSLPQALIRFKQGFGRLIRSDQDSGVFCVLDRRIIEKSYGQKFIRSLPEMRSYRGGSEEIAARIAAWLGR